MRRSMLGATMAAGLLVSGATVFTEPALAASPAHTISGSLQEIGPDDFLSVNPTPPSVYVGVDQHPIVFTGGLSGTAASLEHTAANPNLGFETHNIETFTDVTVTDDQGRVLGEGSLTINFSATGQFVLDGQGNVVAGSYFRGTWQIVQAGGGLAGLHGSGTATGVPGSTTGYGTYTGSVHF